MKILLATHALRGYPPRIGGKPTSHAYSNLFAWAKQKGFDGIEVGDWWFDFYTAHIDDLKRLKEEMEDKGLELAGLNCLRKCITHPAVAEKNKQDLKRTIEVAKIIKPKFVNISLSLDPRISGTADDRLRGLPTSPGGSAGAKKEEFAETAAFLAELAEDALSAKVEVAL